MHEPLPHYFINSSHNTYCTGECVELDCWDGSDGPVVTHGPSAVMRMNEIPLKAVCSAIAECAFKTSPYPVVLSIENHLCQQQQKEMVQIFREAFGSKLLVDPLESHPVWCPSSRKKSEELELLTEDVRRRQLCPVREECTSRDLSKIVNYLTADKVPHTWNGKPSIFIVFLRVSDHMTSNTKTMLVIRIINTTELLIQLHWMMGVQIVALNFQTNSPELLVNHAMFEQTQGSCDHCSIRSLGSTEYIEHRHFVAVDKVNENSVLSFKWAMKTLSILTFSIQHYFVYTTNLYVSCADSSTSQSRFVSSHPLFMKISQLLCVASVAA
uniref:Phosphoinositide phospholipase C n=1 Tax=Angiostrongylus cantonensis TaxID=6313 RepID=A0A158P8R4_ANGCA